MKSQKVNKLYFALCAAALLVLPGASLLTLKANAAIMALRSITLSSSAASATDVTYTIRFNTDPGSPAASIAGMVVEFCNESPIISDSDCTPPPGLDINTASLVLANQSGIVNWVKDNANSTATKLVLTRAASIINPNTVISLDMGASGAADGITNPSTANQSFYARLLTYSLAADAQNYSSATPGPYIDAGGIALSTASQIGVRTKVPPFLFFCAARSISGYDCSSATDLYVNFGEFSSQNTTTGISQLLMLTNWPSGLSLSVHGTTLTSGNNIIKALVPPHASNAGTEQFGMNLVANTVPAVGTDSVGPGNAYAVAGYDVPNHFKYGSGDTIATSTGATDWKKFTVTYVVNINRNQAPGVYTTTLTYICLANF